MERKVSWLLSYSIASLAMFCVKSPVQHEHTFVEQIRCAGCGLNIWRVEAGRLSQLKRTKAA